MTRAIIDTGFPGKPRFELVWEYDDYNKKLFIIDRLNPKHPIRLDGFSPQPEHVDFVDMLCHLDSQYSYERARANFRKRCMEAAIDALRYVTGKNPADSFGEIQKRVADMVFQIEKMDYTDEDRK